MAIFVLSLLQKVYNYINNFQLNRNVINSFPTKLYNQCTMKMKEAIPIGSYCVHFNFFSFYVEVTFMSDKRWLVSEQTVIKELIGIQVCWCSWIELCQVKKRLKGKHNIGKEHIWDERAWQIAYFDVKLIKIR